jgi:hypothetical protein
MTIDDILEILSERGLRIVVGPDGGPILRGPKEEATPALLDVLRIYRTEILARLQDVAAEDKASRKEPEVAPASAETVRPSVERPDRTPEPAQAPAEDPSPRPGAATASTGERPIECKWGRGHIGPHLSPESGWPAGAGWWRYVGDTDWQPIPGRVNAAGEHEYQGPYRTEQARQLWGGSQ